MRKVKSYRPCSSTFSNHYINLIIFHCWIQYFLNLSVKSVNLINKENITLTQVVKYSCHISRLLDCRTGCNLDINPHFISNNSCQSCLSKSRRSIEKHMVKCLSSFLCCLNIYFKITLNLILSNIVIER